MFTFEKVMTVVGTALVTTWAASWADVRAEQLRGLQVLNSQYVTSRPVCEYSVE